MKIDQEKLIEFLGENGAGRIYKFPNYWNSYSAEYYADYRVRDIKESLIDNPVLQNIQPTLDLPLDAIRVCFGAFITDVNYRMMGRFSREQVRPLIHIDILKDRLLEKALNSNKTFVNNISWMTREQLEEHINYLVSPDGLNIPVHISIKEPRNLRKRYFKRIVVPNYLVEIDFTNKTTLKEIKFVLFWLRYVYEAPSNIAMIDAYLLKELFTEEELYNLLILASKMVSKCVTEINNAQCIHYRGWFCEKTRMLQGLKDDSTSDVSDLFKKYPLNHVYTNRNVNYRLDSVCKKFKDFVSTELPKDGYPYFPLDKWLKFEDRFKYYEELYHIYKSDELKYEN